MRTLDNKIRVISSYESSFVELSQGLCMVIACHYNLDGGPVISQIDLKQSGRRVICRVVERQETVIKPCSRQDKS